MKKVDTHGLPSYLMRPRSQEATQEQITRTSQARSVAVRQKPITVPKPPWAKEASQ